MYKRMFEVSARGVVLLRGMGVRYGGIEARGYFALKRKSPRETATLLKCGSGLARDGL